MNVADARKFLKKHNIQFVLAQFVDIHGSAKAKCVPVGHFEELTPPGPDLPVLPYGGWVSAPTGRSTRQLAIFPH